MFSIAAPTALLAHAGHVDAVAGGSHLSSMVVAALPFAAGAALLGRARNGATTAVALFSAAAGFIHAMVTPDHFGEGFAVGLFMLAVTIGQMAVVVAALNRPSRIVWAGAAVANTLVLAIWVVSRTTGLPIGPEPWTPEAVGLLDLACAAYEIAVVAGCLAALDAGAASAKRYQVCVSKS
jgi:hypothetical protein